MSHEIGLRQLKVETNATIATITAQGELGRRIRDLGLVAGTHIQVIGKAPLRDPVAIRLRDFTLTLRNNEADHITVTIMEA
ncbi:MAG: ferrous iron transport protein A [Proteobacteria bacterium]|nr:ferrous iron transport protein A [Pseudomonadota bacterium]